MKAALDIAAPTEASGVSERNDGCERKNAIPTEVGAFTYGTYQTFVSQTWLGAQGRRSKGEWWQSFSGI